MEKLYLDNILLPPCMIGTWAWGTGMNGSKMVFGRNYDKNVLKATFEKAVELGFNFWDTAEVYGGGNSERILGDFIKEHKDVYISTKYQPKSKYKSGLMENSLNNSTKRLGITSPEIYWLHSAKNFRENIVEISALKKQNKIKCIGVSNFNFKQIKEVQALLSKSGMKLDAVQNHYSLISMHEEQNEIIEWCHKNKVVYFAYMVLEQGALTGHYNKNNHFPFFSSRNLNFGKSKFIKITPLLELMKDLGVKYNVDSSQIPIMWAIQKGVVPIVGLTKPKYVERLAESVTKELNLSDVAKLDKVALDTNVQIKCSWEAK